MKPCAKDLSGMLLRRLWPAPSKSCTGQRILLTCFIALCFFCPVLGFQVVVDYSFPVPKVLGVATPSSAQCCPHIRLPGNNTQGMVPPTIFGIGTQKGGTTTLYFHLRKHPKLHGSKKELHYLDDYSDTSYETYLSNWKWNQQDALMTTPSEAEIAPPEGGGLFEISPSYIFIPFAACKAKVISPTAKFVVFLRDPADRAHSAFSFTSKKVVHRTGHPAAWVAKGFAEFVLQGIIELGASPTCDFHSGKGLYSYNDCVGCMIRRPDTGGQCLSRPFVMVDREGDYNCTTFEKEIVLRGMYASQLAWWFTFFSPSRFKIVNSVQFFTEPIETMRAIGKFLEVDPPFSAKMLNEKTKANKQKYIAEDAELVDAAKGVLRKYFRRPNLELYRLLEQTQQNIFPAFEPELREQTTLDCENAETEKCGTQDVEQIIAELRAIFKNKAATEEQTTSPAEGDAQESANSPEGAPYQETAADASPGMAPTDSTQSKDSTSDWDQVDVQDDSSPEETLDRTSTVTASLSQEAESDTAPRRAAVTRSAESWTKATTSEEKPWGSFIHMFYGVIFTALLFTALRMSCRSQARANRRPH